MLAILQINNQIYKYYYDTNVEEVKRINPDGSITSRAYWDIDILEEDITNNDYKIIEDKGNVIEFIKTEGGIQ